jgi:hypothetical protein
MMPMIEELEHHRESIDILVRFLSGDADGPELQAALQTPQMEELLGHFEESRYPALTNHFRRLQKQDRESLGGLLNSQAIIEDFLSKAGVEFSASTRFSDAYSLILESLPKYLDPPVEFILPLIPNDPTMSETKKTQLLKKRLKEAFPCATKPPAWIQSPDWPIVDGKPLVFIGQLPIDLPGMFHDSGMVYVFCSADDGKFETVAQFH